MLEGELRLLHADRREQDHVADASVLRGGQGIRMGLMVDGPGILRHARARGEAGDQHVEVLSGETVAPQGERIGDIAEAQHGGLGNRQIGGCGG